MENAYTYLSTTILVETICVLAVSIAIILASSEKLRRFSLRKNIYIEIGVITIAILFSAILYEVLKADFQDDTLDKFRAATELRLERLKHGINEYTNALYALRIVFESSQYVDYDEFKQVAEKKLKKLPGLRVLAWLPNVTLSERQQLKLKNGALLEAQDVSYLDIVSNNISPSSSANDIHFAVKFIFPDTNFLDIEEQETKNFFTQANRAVLENKTIVTDNVRQISKGLNSTSKNIYIFEPIYQNNKNINSPTARIKAFLGLIIVAVDIDKMFEEIFHKFTRNLGLHVTFIDPQANNEANRVLHYHASRLPQYDQGIYKFSSGLDFAGRYWQIDFESANSVFYPTWSLNIIWLPLSVFLLGIGLVFHLRRLTEHAFHNIKALKYRAALIDSLPNPVFVMDQDGRYTSCNKAYEFEFGITRDELIGKTAHEIKCFSEEERESIYQEDLKFLECKTENVAQEVSITRPDNKKSDYIFWRSMFYLADGEYGGVTGEFLDISHHTRLEAELKKSQRLINAFVDNSPALAYVKDLSGRYLVANKAWCEVMSVEAKDILRKEPAEINLAPIPSCLLENEEKVVRLNQTQTCEFNILNPEGLKQTYISTIFPVSNEAGNIFAVGCAATNITDHIAIEIALADEKLKAEQANESKSSLLANMSHEIRTPMNAIIGMSHLALQTELSDKSRDYILKAHHSAKSLLRIINDILDFSQIEAGKMVMESANFNLAEVLEEFSDLIVHKVAGQKQGIELLIPPLPKSFPLLIGDSLRLKQVLINLGNNAIKFTHSGEVSLNIDILEESDEKITLHFRVRDTGIGIKEEQLGKLFQSFSQADGSITREFGGNGLGLAICKRITEKMNGKIWVESKYREGSTFHFTAEFGVCRDTQLIEPVILPNVLRCNKVLVVDDNDFSRVILSEMISAWGIQVDTASSGKEAIAMIEGQENRIQDYDLLIIDWKMPEMDGTELVEELIDRNKTALIPKILMVSSYAKQALIDAIHKQNIEVQAVLCKPVNPSRLFECILEVFGYEPIQRKQNNLQDQARQCAIDKLRGARILLVEDNEINCMLATALLSPEGIDVTVAENGEVALRLLNSEQFDGVLMDIQMPIMDGYTATKKIRAQNRFSQLPIIALTANVMSDDIKRVITVGMNDHIGKPLNVDELFITMSKWIQPLDRTEANTPMSCLGNNEGHMDIDTLKQQLKSIDVEASLKIMSDDVSLFIKLLERFSLELQSFESDFGAALDNNDLQVAERCAHNLKSNVGSLAIKNAQQKIQLLETACREQCTIHEIKTKLKSVLKILSPTILELKSFFQKNKINQPLSGTQAYQPITDEALQRALNNLYSSLETNDLSSLEIVERLLSHQLSDSLRESLIEISDEVSKYNFQEASARMSVLLESSGLSRLHEEEVI